jgi:hypothetical protein
MLAMSENGPISMLGMPRNGKLACWRCLVSMLALPQMVGNHWASGTSTHPYKNIQELPIPRIKRYKKYRASAELTLRVEGQRYRGEAP